MHTQLVGRHDMSQIVTELELGSSRESEELQIARLATKMYAQLKKAGAVGDVVVTIRIGKS